VELADGSENRRAAVLGCGALGLTTARLLQDRGWSVTIYARELPPHTTSNIAGAQWSPYTVFDSDRTSTAFDAQFERAARIAHRTFQQQVGAGHGVRWIENYVLSQSPLRPQTGPIADLYPASQMLTADAHPFAAPHVRRFTTMLIEPSIFLDRLTRDFLLRGGDIVVREMSDAGEIAALDDGVVFNCTGLGSRALFRDDEMIPIKGQLVFLLPQPEVDYITLAGDYYMFPRSDGILLGGSRERGEWSLETTGAVVDAILGGNRRIFDAMTAG
jgi:glycine/D-amino acid oxidase-like deaminating enzyme